MALRILSPLGPFISHDGAAFNTFTTFQDVSPVGLPLIPQQALEEGLDLWLRARGEFSTTGTPTLSLGFWFNGAAGAAPTTILAQSSAITTGTGAASWPWEMEWEGQLRIAGSGASGGTWNGQGKLLLGTALTTFATPVPIPVSLALRTVTCDVSAARAVGVGAAWSASSASNSIKVNRFRAILVSGL